MPAALRYPTDHHPIIEIRPAFGHFEDFAAVVGTPRPDARGCWCMSYRDSRVPATERSQYMRTECATEPGPGVLVFVDEIPAGWCSIAPRDSYRRLLHSRTIPAPDDPNTWIAVCFVVRVGYRRHGLMHRLLTGAVDHAAAHGATVIEGYPVETADGRVDLISGYVGTVELFSGAGFERVAPTSGRSGGQPRWVMRKRI